MADECRKVSELTQEESYLNQKCTESELKIEEYKKTYQDLKRTHQETLKRKREVTEARLCQLELCRASLVRFTTASSII
jgi:predicted RNase H-like nuclease (RuvC/YqgF family)